MYPILFIMEFNASKTIIIRYYVLPNFIVSKFCNEEYEYTAIKKKKFNFGYWEEWSIAFV